MEALNPCLSLENPGILACSSVITTQLLFLLLRDANPVSALAGGIEAEGVWVLSNSVCRCASRFRPEIVGVVSCRPEQTSTTLGGT